MNKIRLGAYCTGSSTSVSQGRKIEKIQRKGILVRRDHASATLHGEYDDHECEVDTLVEIPDSDLQPSTLEWVKSIREEFLLKEEV